MFRRLTKVFVRRAGMQNAPSLAYSLSQCEDGWTWFVYDEDGVTVADGADNSRAAAEAAVRLAMQRRGGGWEPRTFV